MNRAISIEVLRPARGASLPNLYLLNGALGNEDGVGWINNSTVRDLFADRSVTVVLPAGGRFSFYTDWQQPDPILGVNNWQTYLTRELPAAIDAQFGRTGANAIAGLSMSGASALDLAIAAPGPLPDTVTIFEKCSGAASLWHAATGQRWVVSFSGSGVALCHIVEIA